MYSGHLVTFLYFYVQNQSDLSVGTFQKAAIKEKSTHVEFLKKYKPSIVRFSTKRQIINIPLDLSFFNIQTSNLKLYDVLQ